MKVSALSDALAAGPARRTLLAEGADALDEVLGREARFAQRHEALCLGRREVVPVRAQGADDLLVAAQRDGRFGADLGGKPSRAPRAAIRRSQAIASSSPPPIACPLIAATTGYG